MKLMPTQAMIDYSTTQAFLTIVDALEGDLTSAAQEHTLDYFYGDLTLNQLVNYLTYHNQSIEPIHVDERALKGTLDEHFTD